MVNSNNKIHHVDLHIEKGISQDDLAGSVNLTFQQVQKYEKATNRISASKLYDFAKFLGIDIKYFFEGIDDYVTPEVKINYASDVNKNAFGINVKSKEIENLVEYYKKIPTAEVRKNILALLKSLSS